MNLRLTMRSAASLWVLLALVCLPNLVSLPALAADRLYRYTNQEGNTVVSHAVPSDRVQFGYEVLDTRQFRVIEVIEAQISAEEAVLRAARDRAIASCQTAMKRVKALYRSVEDIDRAENQAVSALENLLENTSANLNQMRKQRGDLHQRAARTERQGRQLPTTLLESIRLTENQITNLEKEISQRNLDQMDAHTQFERDREWYALGNCLLASIE